MNSNSSLKKILILVTILLVPGFLYYLLQEKGKNRYRPLAIYGPRKVAQTYHTKRGKRIPDTIYHQISNFELTDAGGNRFSYPRDTSLIAVFNFFYTRCATCLFNNKQLARIVDQYARNKRLVFYSISVDPDYDNAAVLSEYSKNFSTYHGKWTFLTGTRGKIYSLARNEFLVDVLNNKDDKGRIIHNPFFILVDTHRRIRGYYDPSSKEQMDKLADEIKVLIAEELRMVTSL